jgi:hypothetical protein
MPRNKKSYSFSDLVFKPHRYDRQGVQAVIFFPNGYGASVVQFNGSYTVGPNEWELAVFKGTNFDNAELTYSTPITHDVLGHLSANDVSQKLNEIANLKPAVNA